VAIATYVCTVRGKISGGNDMKTAKPAKKSKLTVTKLEKKVPLMKI